MCDKFYIVEGPGCRLLFELVEKILLHSLGNDGGGRIDRLVDTVVRPLYGKFLRAHAGDQDDARKALEAVRVPPDYGDKGSDHGPLICFLAWAHNRGAFPEYLCVLRFLMSVVGVSITSARVVTRRKRYNAVQLAAKNGDVDVLKCFFLDQTGSGDVVTMLIGDHEHKSPLFLALFAGHFEAVDFMLAQQLPRMKLLLEEAVLEATTGYQAVHVAARRLLLPVLEYLVNTVPCGARILEARAAAADAATPALVVAEELRKGNLTVQRRALAIRVIRYIASTAACGPRAVFTSRRLKENDDPAHNNNNTVVSMLLECAWDGVEFHMDAMQLLAEFAPHELVLEAGATTVGVAMRHRKLPVLELLLTLCSSQQSSCLFLQQSHDGRELGRWLACEAVRVQHWNLLVLLAAQAPQYLSVGHALVITALTHASAWALQKQMVYWLVQHSPSGVAILTEAVVIEDERSMSGASLLAAMAVREGDMEALTFVVQLVPECLHEINCTRSASAVFGDVASPVSAATQAVHSGRWEMLNFVISHAPNASLVLRHRLMLHSPQEEPTCGMVAVACANLAIEQRNLKMLELVAARAPEAFAVRFFMPMTSNYNLLYGYIPPLLMAAAHCNTINGEDFQVFQRVVKWCRGLLQDEFWFDDKYAFPALLSSIEPLWCISPCVHARRVSVADVASWRGNIPMLDFLLHHESFLQSSVRHSVTLLSRLATIATARGHVGVLEYIVSICEDNMMSINWQPSLHAACQYAQLKAFRFLVDRIVDDGGVTALNTLLNTSGPEASAPSTTPLKCLCSCISDHKVRLAFLQYVVVGHGITPDFSTCRCLAEQAIDDNDYEMLSLLAVCAPAVLFDSQTSTSVVLAIFSCSMTSKTSAQRVSLLSWFYERCSDLVLQVADDRGMSLLSLAAEQGQLAEFRYLYDRFVQACKGDAAAVWTAEIVLSSDNAQSLSTFNTMTFPVIDAVFVAALIDGDLEMLTLVLDFRQQATGDDITVIDGEIPYVPRLLASRFLQSPWRLASQALRQRLFDASENDSSMTSGAVLFPKGFTPYLAAACLGHPHILGYLTHRVGDARALDRAVSCVGNFSVRSLSDDVGPQLELEVASVTPALLAAMFGHVDVLEYLVHAAPSGYKVLEFSTPIVNHFPTIGADAMDKLRWRSRDSELLKPPIPPVHHASKKRQSSASQFFSWHYDTRSLLRDGVHGGPFVLSILAAAHVTRRTNVLSFLCQYAPLLMQRFIKSCVVDKADQSLCALVTQVPHVWTTLQLRRTKTGRQLLLTPLLWRCETSLLRNVVCAVNESHSGTTTRAMAGDSLLDIVLHVVLQHSELLCRRDQRGSK